MLKEVCSIKMGQSPASDSYNDNGKGVPFFQGNADFGERYPVARKWCSAPLKMAEPEDILISVRAPIGALNYTKEECCIGRGLAALTPNKSKVSPEFMFWLLKGKNTELNSKGTGSTFKAIGRKVLEEILVPDIGIEQQAEYSAILEKINGIIQLRKHELQKLDDLTKARFIEMFGDPISNPFGWQVKKLADVSVLITNGNTPKGGSENYVDEGIIFLRSQNVWRNRIDLDDVAYIDIDTHVAMKKSSVHDKDILITKTGRINTENSSLGRAALFHGTDNSANINGHIYLVRLDGTVIPEYVVAILTGEPYRRYIRKVCVGGIDKRQINLDQVEDFPIILPPIELQEQFVTFVTQTDKSKVV
ncbi:restriction endonuclease subunit S [Blautia sp. An46]|uniref:restriction endonuclease subunit S n=1 Tax=Blautia sp. An46 TaxID=1965636 RepID=UPI0013A6377F|nr:restriction endonuclease subunit S [Blautia sp. An46]